MEFLVEDDNASSSSDDSDLPDLTSCRQDVNGLDLRAGRAHSALRRSHPVDPADKTAYGISRVDLSFQYNKANSHKNSGETLVSFISFRNVITVVSRAVIKHKMGQKKLYHFLKVCNSCI